MPADAERVSATENEQQGEIVAMKFFGGLSAEEIAAVLSISLATVERKWATARIWLRREMKKSAS
jgi:DNA-directed RNA polymerase specialized sigma24 family protein